MKKYTHHQTLKSPIMSEDSSLKADNIPLAGGSTEDMVLRSHLERGSEYRAVSNSRLG